MRFPRGALYVEQSTRRENGSLRRRWAMMRALIPA